MTNPIQERRNYFEAIKRGVRMFGVTLVALGAMLSMMAGLLTFIAGIYSVMHPPDMDREGYWRNPSLIDILVPPVETAYRASVIKSIQLGTVTIADTTSTNTASITAVVAANTVVSFSGSQAPSNTDNRQNNLYVKLASTTTVSATRSGSVGGATASFSAVEYYSNVLKSNQDFQISILEPASTANATLSTAVTVAKTYVAWRGQSSNNNDVLPPRASATLTLVNTTTVTGTRSTTSDDMTVNGTAVEFR